jgi:hypothetical protein
MSTSGNLENPLIKDLVLQAAVMPVKDYLERCEIPFAQGLYDRVVSDYQRTNVPAENCFALGDFTPSAVLIATSGQQPLGIIDWEFSGVGRGPNGDMAQLLACLHLLLMAASPNYQQYSAVESLIQGICSSYRRHSSQWFEQLHLRKATAPNADEPEPHTSSEAEHLQIFRSALILHGREMVNNAIDRQWPSSSQKESSALVQKMVRKGVWYMERAGDDLKGMLDAANLEELLMEDGRIMLGLFGIEN